MSRIVFATDLHLTEGNGGLEAFAADLDEISASQPDLLVQGGDICLWEQGAGDRLRAMLQDRSFPAVHVMGNHDTARHRSPDELDHDLVAGFGPRNTYTDLGDAHVVTLNTCRMQLQFDDFRNVRAEVGADDLAWFDQTIRSLARDRPLLLFVHIPLATTFPERRGADVDTTNVWRVTNADEVHRRLADWPAPVIVGQGHLHENEHLHRDGVHYVTVGSVCGRWWQQGAGSRCTDGAPRGWMVADVSHGDVQLRYQAARSPAELQGEIVTGDDGATWLNLFFGDPAETVEVHIDGDWLALPAPQHWTGDQDSSTHHWQLPADFPTGVCDVAVRTRHRGTAWDVGRVRRAEGQPS